MGRETINSLDVRENHTHHVNQGLSERVLPANPWRNGLLMQNNGANTMFFAFGRKAEADHSCFQLKAGDVWVMDIFCPKSELCIVGTAGEGVALLESNASRLKIEA